MRTSHITVRKRIENEKLKITDEELFASNAFGAYLTDMAEAATKRYRRTVRVLMSWNTERNADVASTNNRSILINAGNFLTQSFPTRKLRADSLVGMCGHEIGHVLYTDFTALHHYMTAIQGGRWYPSEPDNLSFSEMLNLEEIKELYDSGDAAAIRTIAIAASSFSNILEDVYIEARMCDAFPGSFRTGILLNNLRLPELTPSITEQISRGDHAYAIVVNLIIQYCKSGDVNNLDGYKGEYLDVLYDCAPLIDEAVYDDDVKVRYMASNRMIVKLWQYIKPMIEQVREDMARAASLEEALKKLLKELEDQIVSGAGDPSGKGKPIPGDWSRPDDSDDDDVKNAVEDELGRMELMKTDEISSDGDGGISYDNDFAGTGYASAEEDMNRILGCIAEERVNIHLEDELSDELQAEATRISYGNAHKGVHVTVHRMRTIPDKLMESYKRVSPPLLLLSKRLQKQVMQILKDKREGGKQNGLLFGKRLDSRALVRNDGRVFYKNRLPSEKVQLAVGLLVDESGSMCCQDRITRARAAAIVIYDFCRSLGIPVLVYGHTETDDVDMFAYAEFDSADNKDKYRLMDMSARCGNRDGAALRFVAERLVKRDEEVKLLILISDGQPAADNYYGTAAEADLRGIKREYTNKGITMFAAAIGDDRDNIERIYMDGFLDVTDLSKLPANLACLISRHVKM